MSTHRRLLAAILGCASLFAAACGGSGGPATQVRPADPTFGASTGSATCRAVESYGEPLVVDWKPEHRADLEVSMRETVAVVQYEPPAMAIPPAPTPTSAATTYVSPSPLPSADFLVHADIVKAGKQAIGKVARIEVRRDHYTSGKQFTAVPCADSGSIWLRYTPEQRDLVRAMVGTCALVSFRIVAIRGGLVEGEIAHVANLAPKRATPAPPGADYASIDDAILAGTEAKGKIVEASVSVYDADPKLFWVHDCGRKDSYVFVVPDATNQPLFAQLRNYRIRGCGPAHLLVSDPDFAATWNDGSMQRPRAELVSVP